jgi:hypothetical protein
VKYQTAEAFRTALEQRLKNEAEESGVALMRLRKRVAFERFLARLAASESGGWVLKGAFALELRLGIRTRTTKDIDLARVDDEEAATGHLNSFGDRSWRLLRLRGSAYSSSGRGGGLPCRPLHGSRRSRRTSV